MTYLFVTKNPPTRNHGNNVIVTDILFPIFAPLSVVYSFQIVSEERALR